MHDPAYKHKNHAQLQAEEAATRRAATPPQTEPQAFMAENIYASLALKGLAKETVNVADVGQAQAFATLALAYETRRLRFVGDNIEQAVQGARPGSY